VPKDGPPPKRDRPAGLSGRGRTRRPWRLLLRLATEDRPLAALRSFRQRVAPSDGWEWLVRVGWCPRRPWSGPPGHPPPSRPWVPVAAASGDFMVPYGTAAIDAARAGRPGAVDSLAAAWARPAAPLLPPPLWGTDSTSIREVHSQVHLLMRTVQIFSKTQPLPGRSVPSTERRCARAPNARRGGPDDRGGRPAPAPAALAAVTGLMFCSDEVAMFYDCLFPWHMGCFFGLDFFVSRKMCQSLFVVTKSASIFVDSFPSKGYRLIVDYCV